MIELEEKYEIRDYREFLTKDEKLNELLNEYIIKSCLEVANEASFPTDYVDVKEHLFEKEEYMKLFIVEKDESNLPNIKGFIVCDSFTGYNDMLFMHCHGIILSPEIQGKSLSKTLVNYAVNRCNPDVVTVKTHNPRCFNTFIDIDGVIDYYPNPEGVIPPEIVELYKTDPFIGVSDENLIYRQAYPDEKIQQSKRNKNIDKIFKKLSPYDAQSIVLILNNEKLQENKKKVLKNDHK